MASPEPEKRVPFSLPDLSEAEQLSRARGFCETMASRRSVREFRNQAVPREVIEQAIAAAGQAPSGANLQPWHFVVVTDPVVKREIRVAAEAEEQRFYGGRASEQWLDDLKHLGTDASKPFLEAATLIAVFAVSARVGHGEVGQTRIPNYYVKESVGLACGFLIAAIHHAGLGCLTHTPSPMGFLNRILSRAPEEKPFLLLAVGYPAEGCTVPDISRKPLGEICSFVENNRGHDARPTQTS